MNWIRHNFAYVLVTLIAILLIFFTVQLQYLLRDLPINTQPAEVAQVVTPTTLPTPLLIQPTVVVQAPAVVPVNPTPLPAVNTSADHAAANAAAPVPNQAAAEAAPALSPEELLEIEMLDATNLTTSEDDAVLVDFIKANPYAVGFIRYASYQANQANLRAVNIQTGVGGLPVAANEESVASGAYPFSRPLLLYTSVTDMKSKPQLEGYVGCYLNHLFREIEGVGYTAPSLAMYRDALDNFKATCQRCQMVGSSNPLFPAVPACTAEGIAPVSMDITGGSTVYPLSAHMSELYKAAGFTGAIAIEDIGTSSGFERFCEKGEADLVNASRLVRDKEQAACQAINRELVAFPVGLDLVVVVVSRENAFVQQLSFAQLQQLFTSALRWAEIDPSWPAESIVRAIPNKSRGTFTFFVEMLYAGVNSAPAVIAQAPAAPPPISTPTTPPASPTPAATNTTAPAGRADFRIGIVEQDDDCVAATAIVQAIVERKLGYQVEQVAFPSASALFAAFGGGKAEERIDWSLCYTEPADQPYFEQNRAALSLLNENYREVEGKRYGIISSRAMSRVLQQESPCVYSLLEKLALTGDDVRTQSAAGWIEVHQEVVQTWTNCR
ncbi:MAG: hypothetical protein DYG89_33605 [Caldilinea sp. CFX5]|nr:hypothetical protein [Caldilinea sp. CFX5]